MSARNQIRNLAEVVTLEAWHAAATSESGRADLCVNVAFAAGRIGGRAGDKVRFKLTLKQAQVVVVIPMGEPAKVDPASVRRDGRHRRGVIKETLQNGMESDAKIGVAFDAGAAGGDAHLKLGAGAGVSTSFQRVKEITEALGAVISEHGKDEDGRHRWTLTPAHGDQLLGRVWEDDEQVRLTVVDTRLDRARGLPPSVRVEVRCRREDLEIADIRLTDEPKSLSLERRNLHRNRLVAAEAYLKSRLFEEGLLQGETVDLENPYALLTLAAVAAEEA